MGVRRGHRATDRHRRRQPVGRGCGRDHGADPQGPPWQRGLPFRGFVRGGDGGGAGRVRGGAAPQRGGSVVSRRRLAAMILGAGIVTRGWVGGGGGGGAGRVGGGAAPQRGGSVVSRRRLAAMILGAWIVTLGWLVKREVFAPTGARLAEAALRVPPGAVYYRLAVAERQGGVASSTTDTRHED